MTALSGVNGNVKLSTNTVAEIDNWDLDIGRDLHDTTAFGDVAKEFTAGIYEWSAKCSGRLDMTDTNGQLAIHTAMLSGATVSLRLYETATKYWSGTAYIEKMVPKSEEQGVNEVEFSFKGSGALTYT